MGWDPDKHFVVPAEVLAHMNVRRARPPARGTTGSSGFDLVGRVPDVREKWDAAWAGTRSARGEAPEFEPGEEIATRDAGKAVMQAFKDACRR